jgi:hypothetical protein
MRKGVISHTLAATTLITILLAAPVAAWADDVIVAQDGTGATIKVATNGSPAATGAGASGRICSWTVTQANTPEPFRSIWAKVPPPAGETPNSGQWARWDCSDGTAGISWLPNSRPVVAPAVLAQEAYRHLPLPQPQIGVNPVAGREQFVNLPTWLWISPLTWGVRSATASVPGLSATATATPIGTMWTMGEAARSSAVVPAPPTVRGSPLAAPAPIAATSTATAPPPRPVAPTS